MILPPHICNAYCAYYDWESLTEAARRHAARGDLERAEVYAEYAADLLETAQDHTPVQVRLM